MCCVWHGEDYKWVRFLENAMQRGARRQSPGLGTVDAAEWRHAVVTTAATGPVALQFGEAIAACY